ncbi:hypothetical protein BMETH_1385_0 [methanotrophic bacterial endosymbiont of Bathymodiolus sp.]|nr:hypothetical protein BMETH_1385_0 [methanotrophic bacterial endosymbiont of Bathymodiolus sp.]
MARPLRLEFAGVTFIILLRVVIAVKIFTVMMAIENNG